LLLSATMRPVPTPVRVLVVDDDEMSRELLSVLLDGQGYAVETAESGQAALERLRSPAGLPEVILSDMQMPGVSGPELASRIRAAIDGRSVLLAMSGSQPAQDAVSQFDGFLLKPFSADRPAVDHRYRYVAPCRACERAGKLELLETAQNIQAGTGNADGRNSVVVH